MINKRIIYIILAAVILIFFIIGIFFFLYKKQPEQELSERSKEFIKNNYPDFRDKEIENNIGTIYSTKCFSLKLPFISRNQKFEETEKGCTFRARVIEPASQLVISNEKLKVPLKEHPSISMRFIEKTKYINTELVIKGFDKVYRFDEEQSVVFFLKKGENLITIAFSNIADTNNITQEAIIEITESFIFL